MNSETRLTFPIDEVPKYGTLFNINEHINWVRMPLPMSLNHVNLWTLGGIDDLTLIDTGMQLDDTKDAWINLIKNENLNINNVIVTHMHPDHTGGNENFGKRGALIVGHENVRSQMKVAGYDQTPPFVTFSKDVNFHINDENIHVFKVPRAPFSHSKAAKSGLWTSTKASSRR